MADADYELQDEEEAYCPLCGGPGYELGALGPTRHFRCRDCGTDFSDDVKMAATITSWNSVMKQESPALSDPDLYVKTADDQDMPSPQAAERLAEEAAKPLLEQGDIDELMCATDCPEGCVLDFWMSPGKCEHGYASAGRTHGGEV